MLVRAVITYLFDMVWYMYICIYIYIYIQIYMYQTMSNRYVMTARTNIGHTIRFLRVDQVLRYTTLHYTTLHYSMLYYIILDYIPYTMYYILYTIYYILYYTILYYSSMSNSSTRDVWPDMATACGKAVSESRRCYVLLSLLLLLLLSLLLLLLLL